MAIWRLRIACWINKATNTLSQYLLLSHSNRSYTKSPQCYVIRTLHILLLVFDEFWEPNRRFILKMNFYFREGFID